MGEMMELIDKNELFEMFGAKKKCDECRISIKECSRQEYSIKDFCNTIDSCDVVDAVPVVRCKDCVHSKPNDGKLVEGARYCTMHTDGYTLDAVLDCDFCSYGEHRKSDK